MYGPYILSTKCARGNHFLTQILKSLAQKNGEVAETFELPYIIHHVCIAKLQVLTDGINIHTCCIYKIIFGEPYLFHNA